MLQTGYMNRSEDPAARIQRCLDDYDAGGDPALILGESVLTDARSLLSASEADATLTPGGFRAGQRLVAGLFWRRFLSRDVVDKSVPMASVRVILPVSADDSESLLDIVLNVGDDPAASQDLAIALWLYAVLLPEDDEVPAALRPLCQARRDVSAWRFGRSAREITELLDEFDRTGDGQAARRALDLTLSVADAGRGIVTHLGPADLSRYLVLNCDVLMCLHAAERHRAALETLLTLLRQGLTTGMFTGEDRFRAVEILLRTMADTPRWTALAPDVASAARETLCVLAASSGTATERDGAFVLLGKLLLFWSAHDPDPALLDEAIERLRESSTHVQGTAEHVPVLWALHAALTRRCKRNRAPADHAAADDVLMMLAGVGYDALPHGLAKEQVLTRLGMRLWKSHLRTDDQRYREAAEEALRAAVLATAPDDPQFPRRLRKLIVTRPPRERDADLRAFAQAVTDSLAATVDALASDLPEAWRWTIVLAQTLETRYDHLGDVQALGQAFARYRTALQQIGDDDPELRLVILSRVSQLLILIFEETDDPKAAEAAVDAIGRALRITPRETPGFPAVLVSYGAALSTLTDATSDGTALPEYTATVRSVLDEGTAGKLRLTTRDRADLFAALARTLHDLWQGGGDHALLRDAIDAARAAISLGPYAIRPSALLSLTGMMLSQLGDLHGDLSLLNEAIAMHRAALGRESEDTPGHYSTLQNLAISLFQKYQHTSDRAALEEACVLQYTAASRCRRTSFLFRQVVSNLASIMSAWVGPEHSEIIRDLVSWQREVINSSRPDAPERVRSLAILSINLLKLAERMTDSSQALIDEAIAVAESALASGADGEMHPMLAQALARCYLERADNPDGPRQAIAILRQVITGDEEGKQPALLHYLGRALVAEHRRTGDPALLEQAKNVFRRLARGPAVGVTERITAARSWGSIANALGDVRSACEGFSTAVSLLELMAWRGLRDDDQQRLLAGQLGLARTAAALAIECGDHERAVELLEQGRGILLGRLAGRSGYAILHSVAPELAAELRSVQNRLDTLPEDRTTVAAFKRSRPADVRAELAHEHAALVAAVRELPGWQDFLRSPAFGDLAGAAAHGPVVLLNTSELRCDALVVTPQGVRPVPLPGLTEETLHSHAGEFLVATEVLGRTRASSGSIAAALAHRDSVADVLEWLWDTVAQPVLAALAEPAPVGALPGTGARLWWCPTGSLAFLPLHAAGRYRLAQGTGPDRTSVLELVTSSYTPTLRSLLGSERRAPVQPRSPLLVAVDAIDDAALPAIDHDVRAFLKHFPDGRVLHDDDATAAEVLAAMAESDWVQFACHAYADPGDPFASGVILADKPATARDMSRAHGRAASVALLLGCTTGRLGGALGDEAISLATTLRAAGFAHAVGTLWPVDDQDASFVAEHILRSAAAAGTDDMASLVHAAVRALREKVPHAPARWGAFVHVGG